MTHHPEDVPCTPPREYQHMLRGARLAWWRPLVAYLLVAGFLLGFALLVGGFLLATGRQFPANATAPGEMGVAIFAVTNLLLASLIPIAMLSNRIAHGVDSARYLSSVAGGLRWHWMFRCLLITAPVFIFSVAVGLLFDWPQTPRPAEWLLLVLLVIIGTPLQAAGEEYISRGLIAQNVGAWFRNRRTAMVMATIVSTLLFTAAHGSSDPWILLDLGIVAVACSILVWRTGGLEAAIVLHAVGNMTGMIASLVFGGWGEDFVQGTSQGKPQEPAVTLVVMSIVVALILRKAKQEGIQRVHRPAPEPAPGTNAEPRRAAIFTVPSVTFSVLVLVTSLWATYAGMEPREAVRPPGLHYADIAKTMGVTPDGCLRGKRVDSLPLEIRHDGSRELVGDDVHMFIGDLAIRGHNGIFQFPLSEQMMTANEEFWVVQADGKKIDYHFQFLSVSVESKEACESRGPPDPPAA